MEKIYNKLHKSMKGEKMLTITIICGICIGIFLNICIYEIPREEPILFSIFGSKAVVKSILTKVKCKSFKSKIVIKYLLIVLLNTLIYTGIYIKFGINFEFFKLTIFSSWLIVIGVIDLKTGYIYEKTIIFIGCFGVISFIYEWYITRCLPLSLIYGAIIGFIIMYIIFKVTGGIGEGDIEITTISGFLLGGKSTVLILCLAFIMVAIIASILLSLRIKDRKDKIAFGPYIFLAVIINIFMGENLINYYINFI